MGLIRDITKVFARPSDSVKIFMRIADGDERARLEAEQRFLGARIAYSYKGRHNDVTIKEGIVGRVVIDRSIAHLGKPVLIVEETTPAYPGPGGISNVKVSEASIIQRA